MNAKQVLEAGRSYLVTHGWCQGGGNSGGARCMHLAMPSALDVEFAKGDAMCLLNQALGFGSVVDAQSIWDFNDAPGRTAAQCIAVFDAAIELADAIYPADDLTPEEADAIYDSLPSDTAPDISDVPTGRYTWTPPVLGVVTSVQA